jgi:hypothetical protein
MKNLIKEASATGKLKEMKAELEKLQGQSK